MDDGATPPTDQLELENPNYWTGRWYEDIKSYVQLVAGEMRNNGVDPTLISPEDAWTHFSNRTAAGQREIEARGHVVPAIFKDILTADSPCSQVFKAMWRLLDLKKLLKA